MPYRTDPKHILHYVEEELECGHKLTVLPTGAETFAARNEVAMNALPG